MNKDSKIFVAGHEGMIGSALLRCLREEGFNKLLTRASSELDLIEQKKVFDFFMDERPDYVFLAAARMGSILANSKYPADFIYENIQIQSNVIQSAWKSGVKKLLFLGSTCVYPRLCPQPMKEEHLLTGPLEPTSEPYAIAKIAGIRMCQSYNSQYGTSYISVVPATLYGPDSHFDLETSHVLSALIRKLHEAKVNNEKGVTLWGTGSPRREFLHADDLADACVFLMKNYDESEMINVGSGEDLSIKELALLIKGIVGYTGELIFDTSMPDGAPQKLLDSGRIRGMGWTPKIGLENGIRQTYEWYKNRATANI